MPPSSCQRFGTPRVLYDRGYLSYALLIAHVHQGVEAVFRVQKGVTFLPIQQFWKSKRLEKIVTIDPTSVTYRNTKKLYPEYELKAIRLRLIKYQMEGKTYVLATTILDGDISREDFITLYAKRWWIEENYKALKQALELEVFHSQTLNGVEQEVEATALFWNICRILGTMAEPHIKKISLLLIFIALSAQLSAMPT